MPTVTGRVAAIAVADGSELWRVPKAPNYFVQVDGDLVITADIPLAAEAIEKGAKTLVIGVANRGGVISPGETP